MNNSFRQFALFYYGLEFNVTHITPQKISNENGETEYTLKQPSHAFESLENERQSIEDLLSLKWDEATGIGAVMGFNNLRSIDIDGCNSDEFILEFLNQIGLQNTYEWVVKTGSGKGFQIIFYASNHSFEVPKKKVLSLFPKDKYKYLFSHIELRWIGQVVLPPSLHISGNNYTFINNLLPSTPPHTIDLKKLEDYISTICISHKDVDKENRYFDNFNEEVYAYKFNETSQGNKTYRGLYKEPFYLFLDIETNGLPEDGANPENNPEAFPEIIQIATLFCDSTGKRVNKESVYFKPYWTELKSEVLELLKIDRDTIMKKGVEISYFNDSLGYYYPPEDCFNDLFQPFGKNSDFKFDFIVGHNVDFDLDCLLASLYRNKVSDNLLSYCKGLYFNLLQNIPNLKKICMMKSTIDFCSIKGKYGNKYPSLGELYKKLFEEEIIGAHSAENDVFNTAKCYWKLRDLGLIK